MKTHVLISLLFGALLSACTRTSEPVPDDTINQLHDQFHGKYKVIRATSDVAVDINLDGTPSTDMTKEYTYLESTELRIDLRGANQYVAEDVFVFTQSWLEQYVTTPTGDWKGEVVDYQPGARINQVHQGTARYFTLSPDRKTIYVTPNSDSHAEQTFRWVRPESVTVEFNGQLTVVNKRRVYTSAGVKDIYITTLYERYTMIT